jgi:hypothetical protein
VRTVRTPQSKHGTNLGVTFRVPGMQRYGIQVESAIQIHSGDNVLKDWDNALYGGDVPLLESQGGWCSRNNGLGGRPSDGIDSGLGGGLRGRRGRRGWFRKILVGNIAG